MEQTEYFDQVAPAYHRSVIVDLIVFVEQIEQVFEFLEGVAGSDTRFFVTLDHILDFLASILSTCRLLNFLDQCIVIIRLINDQLLLLLQYDS